MESSVSEGSAQPSSTSQGLGRREFLARGAGALMATGLGSSFLAACGGGGGNKSDGKLVIGAPQSYIEPFKPMVAEYAKQKGIKVDLQTLPGGSGVELIQTLTPQFSSSTTPYDVVYSSDEATPGFMRAGWLEPLDDILPSGFWNDFPEEMIRYTDTWSRLNGHTYRVPGEWDIGYYWVNQDLLDEIGAKAPQSWDDIRALGAKAKAKGLYIFADAASKPALASVLVAFLSQQAGGNMFAFDQGTRQAFEFLGELSHAGYFPKDAPSWSYDQLNAAYTSNKVVTMRQWNYFYDVARADKKWYKPSRVKPVLPPKGPVQRAAWAGAWGFVIPKFSQRIDTAKDWVRWITAKEQAVKMAKASGTFLTARKSVLAAIGNTGLAPALAEYSKAGVVKNRPFHPQVTQAQDAVDTALTSYLTGQASLDAAMAQGKRRIAALKSG